MKTKFKALAGLLFAIGLVTTASAQRANQALMNGPLKAATSQEEIQNLKKGQKYAKVCMECKSITVKEIADEKEAAALCHDGGTMHCDSCKKEVRVKRGGPRGNIITSTVEYVNSEGKECMFIVPIPKE